MTDTGRWADVDLQSIDDFVGEPAGCGPPQERGLSVDSVDLASCSVCGSVQRVQIGRNLTDASAGEEANGDGEREDAHPFVDSKPGDRVRKVDAHSLDDESAARVSGDVHGE